MSIIAKKNFR